MTVADDLLWEYEDALSEAMDGKVYDAVFPSSRVVSGVRMFPYVIIDDQRFYLAMVRDWVEGDTNGKPRR